MTKLPDNWRSYIVPAIIRRAFCRCEMCGVANGSRGWWYRGEFHLCSATTKPPAGRVVKINLAVVAKDHKPSNNDLMAHRAPAPPFHQSNLMAVCQRCLSIHDRSKPKRRRRPKQEQKQLELFK